MMKPNSFVRLSITCLAVTLFIMSCKGPETTVVRQNPTPAAPDSIAEDTDAGVSSATFRQLNIGELNPIPTLDPLFAENTSTMRALQLVHEGLVRYDANGSVVPGLAKKWDISDDSLTFRFTLRNDIYYHDSNAFSNGLGRKLVSRDVKTAFERMAKVNVPDRAAQLFMDIKGFEPYYQEQHHVFNPKQRVLEGVDGITTPNDSTVVFTLAENKGHFLQKLTSPYAVIYPREAIVGNDPTQFKAVGAGPFILSQQKGDSLYIFAKFKDYYDSSQPVINRIDVAVKKSEPNLLQGFSNGDVHLIPELGVQLIKDMLNSNGELQSSYSANYNLAQPDGKTYYTLNFNRNANLSENKALAISSLIDSTYSFGNVPNGLIRFMNFTKQTSTATSLETEDAFTITHSDNIFEREFISKLSNDIQKKGASLQVQQIRIPNRNTGLYMQSNIPFYPGQSWPYGLEHYMLGGFETPQLVLYRNDIEDLAFNRFPWWLDLRTVTLPALDNL